jgi:hypothetical protein
MQSVGAVLAGAALTNEECRSWLTILDGRGFGRGRLTCQTWCPFLLGSGCRIGEALAQPGRAFDLERHLINIDAMLMRARGQGLLVERPKTKSSVRVLCVQLWPVTILPEGTQTHWSRLT